MSWLKDNVTEPVMSSMAGIFAPRNSLSITNSKGLLNAPGENNCFLNSAVQAAHLSNIMVPASQPSKSLNRIPLGKCKPRPWQDFALSPNARWRKDLLRKLEKMFGDMDPKGLLQKRQLCLSMVLKSVAVPVSIIKATETEINQLSLRSARKDRRYAVWHYGNHELGLGTASRYVSVWEGPTSCL
ncbi:protein deubiquitination [Branchiostoma belcheri]|nr:protein deubiquitination [Branchiostoma belcheri]